MNVVAVINIEAVQGKSSEALEVIKKNQQHCLTLDICSGFEILQNQENKHKFIFIERWSSAKEHKAFLSELMSNELFIQDMAVFISSPDIQYFDIS